MLPPFPDWDGMHPLVVHFPIALLLVAPLFVVLGLILPKQWNGLATAALVLMILGTLGAFVAVSTGEAGGELVERNEAISATLEHHEDLAETTRTVFAVLTLIFAAIVVTPVVLRTTVKPMLRTGLCVAFLCLYAFGAVLLANTAHEGGRLVHEHGVQALIAAGPSALGESVEHEDREDDR